MAKTDMGHIYVGRWAVCGIGKIGLVQTAEQRTNGVFCKGIGLDHKPWTAHNPKLLHKSYHTTFERLHNKSRPPELSSVKYTQRDAGDTSTELG